MSIVKIAVFGVVAAVMALSVKSVKGEYANYVSLAAAVLIFGYTLSKLEVIVDSISTLSRYISISNEYIAVLIKVIGISYICEFASSLCKDAGHATIGSQIETVGKLTILVMSMPILMSLLETIDSFLK